MNTLFLIFMTGLIHLVPAPVKTTLKEGVFTLNNSLKVYVAPQAKKTAADAAVYFFETIGPSMGINAVYTNTQPSGNVLIFELKDATEVPAEGYFLEVSPTCIIISASDGAGFFYGVQTLLQLLPPYVYEPVYHPDQDDPSLSCAVPCILIEDYPRFSHRGMMMDVSRQFYSVTYVKQYIDWMAKHKLNRFHWHLSDDNGWRLEIKKYPLLTEKGAWRGPGEVLATSYGHPGERYGGFYTQQEIKDIVTYAAKRHIEIIPEIDLPGHGKAATGSYPEILCNTSGEAELSIQGVSHNVWCATREENYKMLEDIIREMVSLFPSKYFHVGGDEVVTSQWSACSLCRDFMHSHNMSEPIELQSYFMGRMQKILKKFGKTMIGWDEVMEGGELDRKDVIIHAWQRVDKIKEATSKGYRVIAQPAAYCYLDMKQTIHERGLMWAAIIDLEKVYSLDPIKTPGLTPEEARLVMGVQGGLWAEMLDKPARIAEYQTYPRLCALAEVAWSPQENRVWEDFNKRLSQTHFERLYYMGINFRIPYPDAAYVNGYICARTDYPWMVIRYTCDGSEPDGRSPLYTGPISTDNPEKYLFASFYGNRIRSIVREVDLPYDRYQRPVTRVTGNVAIHPRTPYTVLEDNDSNTYLRVVKPLEEGQYILYTFESPVTADRISVLTGLPGVDIDPADYAHVEYSADGIDFVPSGSEWKDGRCVFAPKGPVKAVKLCFDKGNMFLTSYIQDLRIDK
ncbi:MAG: family 20 glycosylhydrolase [Bacteroidales bacterium]